VVWGEFEDKPTGTKFFHFNTHFDNLSQNARNKSAELLITRIQARSPAAPFVVTGDFNANEKNEATLYLQGKGKLDGAANPLPLIDSFRALHPSTHAAGTYGDFIPTKINGSKIDYVYMGPKVTAVQAAIDRTEKNGEFPSDHWEIEAVVKIPVSP
jgi:endonuclease/exonuclease/phosphatase family metal-dependent hydrolase